MATSCANTLLPGQVNGQGFSKLNLAAQYAFGSGWRASLGFYNVLNTHAGDPEFWYIDRLKSEIAETRSVRPPSISIRSSRSCA